MFSENEGGKIIAEVYAKSPPLAHGGNKLVIYVTFSK